MLESGLQKCTAKFPGMDNDGPGVCQNGSDPEISA